LKNKNITIYGDGEQTRTFCYIADNISFTQQILLDNLYINNVVNVGSHILVTIKELAIAIIRVTNSKVDIVHLPPLMEGDMTRRQPDNNNMLKTLNRDLISLENGLEKIVRAWL